jgi:hypothetical protein
MMETSGRKIIFYFILLIGKNFITSIAGMWNNNILIRVLWIGIFMVTQLFGTRAREYLFYCPDDLLAKRILVSG